MHRTRSIYVLAAACAVALPPSAIAETDATPIRHPRHHHTVKKPHDAAAAGKETGNASFYAKHFTGRKTASGERYDPTALTAAHRTLPLGTLVKVVNPKNDKSVVVTVNDRGPVPKNRMIDLSGAAAKQIGMTKSGVTKVETEVVGKSDLSKGDAKDAIEGEKERR